MLWTLLYRASRYPKQPRYLWKALAYFSSDQTKPFPRFADLLELDRNLKATLDEHGFEFMTEIQAATWKPAIEGRNIVARARTGTGKTLAFLLSSIHRVQKSGKDTDNNMVRALVISPTRELADQIHQQAQILSKRKESGTSQVVYGGIKKSRDLSNFEKKIPMILTATPGRLKDHIQTTRVKGHPFKAYLSGVQVLVLDEMDRLLDLGFRDDIFEIIEQCLPAERQTMLFSATIPKGFDEIVRKCVGDDFDMIDCIEEDDPLTHTNEAIDQRFVVLNDSRIIWGLVQIILHYMKKPNHKIMVFFSTTAEVKYFGHLFNHYLGRRVLEIHSKMKQSSRQNTSDLFRRTSTNAVLFTSDVSARGLDYPEVTHVIQFGASSDRETYLHRLGRTGRAGSEGKGILVLTSLEADFIDTTLKGLDIEQDDDLQRLLERPLPANLSDDLFRIHEEAAEYSETPYTKATSMAYLAILGAYSSRLKPRSQRNLTRLVQTVNAFASQAGLKELPVVSTKILGKLGLQSTGLNTREKWKTAFQLSGISPRRVTSLSMSSALIVQNKGGGHGELGYQIAKVLKDHEKIESITILQDSACNDKKEPFKSYSTDLPDVKIVKAALGDESMTKESLQAALGGQSFDYVWDNASKGPVGAGKAIVDCAQEWGVKLYTYVSSAGMYKPGKDGPFPMPETTPIKETAGQNLLDQYAIEKGLPLVSFRPQYIYGPKANKYDYIDYYFDRIVRGLPVPIPGDGSQLVSLTCSEDVASLLCAPLNNEAAAVEQRFFNCGTDKLHSYDEVAYLCAEAAGISDVKIEHFDADLYGKGDFPFRPTNFYVSPDTAKEKLSWSGAKHSLKEDLTWYYEGYKARGGLDREVNFLKDWEIVCGSKTTVPEEVDSIYSKYNQLKLES